MKKIMSYLVIFMLVATIASAGWGDLRSPTPRPFSIYFTYNGVPAEGFSVDFSIDSQSITKKTNVQGGVGIDWDIGYSPDFPEGKDVTGIAFLSKTLVVNCGLEVCNGEFLLDDLSIPSEIRYELAGTPYIPDEPDPEPEPEPETPVEDKVTSNADGTIALVESNYGDCIDVVITDNDLAKLFDGIIDFDTEEYDAHEEILVKMCSETSIDNPDFNLEPRILLEEAGVEVRYVFDDTILFTLDDDEELEINFIDKDIEIISLSATKMIIRHGEVFDYQEGCVEGEEITYDGLSLNIISISEDSVYLSYNGDSRQIFRDNIDEVGGIQIYVDESIQRENDKNICSIRVAEDIEEVIKDGDEYAEGWDYSVQDGYIGIRTNEEYRFLDEEYKPLALGDKIEIPNNFSVVKFNKISTSDITEIDIRIRDGYFNVKGSREDGNEDAFTYNNQDYDELYVGAEGILDQDKVLISDKVRIGESDVYLEKGSIIIGDLTIEFDFADIFHVGISFATKDDNYLDYSGITFRNPQDSVENEGVFDITVPDEVPEITITIGAESETEGLPDEPTACPKPTVEDCKDTVCESKACITAPCTPVDCTPTDECPEVPEGLTGGQIIIFITSLLGIGGIGIFAGKQLTRDQISKIRNVTYRVRVERDGDIVEEHRHAGIRSFHGINVSHRDEHERHPRGERYPHFEKDDAGIYKYIKS